MSTRAAYNTFVIFQSVKLHFNNKRFDFTHSRVKIKPESFLARRDVGQFQRLSELIKKEDVLTEFSISCFLYNPRTWIGEVFSDEYLESHSRRIRRVQGIQHTFEKDVDSLLIWCQANGFSNIKSVLTSGSGLPIIHTLNLEEETKAIFDIFFSYTKKECPDPTWPEVSTVTHKYGVLLWRKLKEESKQKEAIEHIVANVVATLSK